MHCLELCIRSFSLMLNWNRPGCLLRNINKQLNNLLFRFGVSCRVGLGKCTNVFDMPCAFHVHANRRVFAVHVQGSIDLTTRHAASTRSDILKAIEVKHGLAV